MSLDIPLYRKKKRPKTPLFLGVLAMLTIAFLLYQLPSVRQRLEWRIDVAWTYLRGIFDPVEPLPAPLSATAEDLPSTPAPLYIPTLTQSPLPTPQGIIPHTDMPEQVQATPMIIPTPTPLPGLAILTEPEFILQDWNNCGPATLAMNLNFYGWEGSQFDISDTLKPMRNDRNVNPEEMMGYIHSKTAFHSLVRVGGDIDLLRRLVANGFPVIVEETFHFSEDFWPHDDHWGAHYLLITGYNDRINSFIVQNSFVGAHQYIKYDILEQNWRPFNYLYMLVYPPELGDVLQGLLGEDFDVEQNRQHALAITQAELVEEPENAFSWFNLGSNLVYFEEYVQAAEAYDTARSLDLPQRMLRYQFGPFHAYFQSGRFDDLLALAEYALDRTPTSEEAMLWYGWALYSKGEVNLAQHYFNNALYARPGYTDAEYALEYLLSH